MNLKFVFFVLALLSSSAHARPAARQIADFPLIAEYFQAVSREFLREKGQNLFFASDIKAPQIPEGALCETQQAKDVILAISALKSNLLNIELAESIAEFIGPSNFMVCQKTKQAEGKTLQTYFIADDKSLYLEISF